MSPAAARQKLGTPKREVELSLVIAASAPDEVYRKLARLRKLDRYSLVPRGSQRLVDEYFDTPDGKLRKRGFALRLRAVNGSVALGLKGRARAKEADEDRLEAERPFSEAAIDEVRARAHLPAARVDSRQGDDPASILEQALGVRPIQTRETVRLARDVVRLESKASVAELVLDRVHFNVDDLAVRHYEVEVESKKPGEGRRAVRELSDELLNRYPDDLLPWPYGKLATGKALEELAKRRRLNGLVDDGVLSRDGYARLRSYLERHPAAD